VLTVYTSCGFQSKLQVQSPLASFLTADNFASTVSPTSHTAIRYGALYNSNKNHHFMGLKCCVLKSNFAHY